MDELYAMFQKWPEVDCLHSHVGSQGVDLHLMVEGVHFILSLADQLNEVLHRKQVDFPQLSLLDFCS